MHGGPPSLLLTIMSWGGSGPAGRWRGTMDVVRSFGGIEVKLTNPDKVLFPKDGLTKEGLAGYYSRISAAMLPHMRGRPVTMVRHPDGIGGESFYQKEVPPRYPEWLRTVTVKKEGGTVRQLVCGKEADLAYLANLACITPHIWLSREDRPDRPDRLIFDLDPHERGFGLARTIALEMRDELDSLGMRAFVMSTGSKGLHVAVPLDRSAGFDSSRTFAREVAERIAGEHRDEVTLDASKEQREGRLFIDIYRNAYGQTGVAPYAVRARDGAPVATPLKWEEVEEGKAGPQSYNVSNVLIRSEMLGDPWKSIDERPASVAKGMSELKKRPR